MTASPTTATGRALVWPPHTDVPFVTFDPPEVAATRYRHVDGYRVTPTPPPPAELVRQGLVLVGGCIVLSIVAGVCAAADRWQVATPTGVASMLLLVWAFAAAWRADVSAAQGAG